ncbi:hypothetical protein F5B22DRAFT_10732 [Xylaria bambusicola]|uniref:uncharacterized protein n=1 Tax=Xylaria bambusicola TaxID=326684 RepID=UPI00200829A1|nr:uncharacterized protein F5B22DRAFT_10732 [Xylaria bambusicola]KAI0527920.1 hypothetical protein F5B22DRAFT_10732 [Xylaria bambusicola]
MWKKCVPRLRRPWVMFEMAWWAMSRMDGDGCTVGTGSPSPTSPYLIVVVSVHAYVGSMETGGLGSYLHHNPSWVPEGGRAIITCKYWASKRGQCSHAYNSRNVVDRLDRDRYQLH